ncbi:glycosyltransferase family 4 protein [Penaeicola halotolerans]|uniref:glycosyltransferase family 4 protein n=1 Tax=Penaeicola halotolerans TaxID=2793196 RepID=UPI001CF8B380|nr:glycosyltransferase family 4 protein [Penaeicola halotolerans]
MSDKSKILFLHSSGDLYGASRIMLYSIEIVIAADYEVKVILPAEGNFSEELTRRKIPFEIFNLGIIRRKYFSIKGLFNRYSRMRAAAKRIAHICRSEGVTHIYSNTTGVLVGGYVARKLQIKHIWHVHEILSHPRWLAKIIGFWINLTATAVVYVSQAVARAWQPFVQKPQAFQVYNGLNYQQLLDTDQRVKLRKEWGISEEQVLIGMIARVHYWKGQTYFLEIAAKLKEKHPNVQFLMVGDAYPGYEYLYEEIAQKKQKLKIESSVTDLGFRTDIPDILSALDIFVLPSILPDPLPTTVLEAMGSGRAVAATNHGGATEMVIVGETGVLIPFDDAEEAANLISPLIMDDTKRSVFGKSAQNRVLKHFSLESYAQHMKRVFEF